MDNRERILQCALELFYAKGYDAVGVQEIAQKAGITKPTLYYYFGSKYGLLETLLTKHFTVLNEGAGIFLCRGCRSDALQYCFCIFRLCDEKL